MAWACDDAQVAVDDDVGLGAQPVADPAQPDLPDAAHARRRRAGRLGRVDQRRVDGVHQPPVHLAGGILEHDQDRDGDEQADDRVGPAPAERDAAGAERATAREVKPSVRACRPSATSAAEPILRPVRMR